MRGLNILLPMFRLTSTPALTGKILPGNGAGKQLCTMQIQSG